MKIAPGHRSMLAEGYQSRGSRTPVARTTPQTGRWFLRREEWFLRRNARRSTGPRTAAGKRKAGANSLRHGLAVSVPDPATNAAVARIASVLAGQDASPGKLALVMPIAEAQAEVLRARNARVALINLAASNLPGPDSQAEAIYQSLETLTRLDRYERRAMARRNRALCDLRNFQTEE